MVGLVTSSTIDTLDRINLSADLMTMILDAKIWKLLNMKSDCEVLKLLYDFSCLV